MANLMVLCVSHFGPINHMLNGLSVDVRRHLFLHFLLLKHFVFLDNLILDGLGRFHLISTTVFRGKRSGSSGLLFNGYFIDTCTSI